MGGSRLTVTHPPGLDLHAEALASHLRTPVTAQASQNTAARVITLTVGADYTGLLG